MQSAVPSSFGGRAGSEVSIGLLFSQDELSATALVGGLVGVEEIELVSSVSGGFFWA